MPRIRTIKPKFWDDIKLSKISRNARLLYIGIWNFCDDLGVIIADHSWIKSRVFPFDKIEISEFESWLNELINEKFLQKFQNSAENFYFLPNFLKHQVISKPNFSELLIPPKALIRKLKESRINHGLITERSRNDHGTIRVGKEGKGYKERKGREGRDPTEFEQEIFSDTKFFETIGIAWKINQAAFRQMVNDFQTILQVQEKKHNDYAEFKSHFFNWGAQKFTNYLNGSGKKSTWQKREKDDY